jgi:hypothetical protein
MSLVYNINKLFENAADLKKMTIIYRDYENSLEEIIDGIKTLGNCGHSFEIILDPDNKPIKCGWDGDGGNFIKDVKVEEYK